MGKKYYLTVEEMLVNGHFYQYLSVFNLVSSLFIFK